MSPDEEFRENLKQKLSDFIIRVNDLKYSTQHLLLISGNPMVTNKVLNPMDDFVNEASPLIEAILKIHPLDLPSGLYAQSPERINAILPFQSP